MLKVISLILLTSALVIAEPSKGRVIGGWIENISGAPVAFLPDGGYRFCSGVVVSRDAVLTAKHCLGASNFVGINGKYYRRRSAVGFRGADLAIVKIRGSFPVRSVAISPGLRLRSGNLILVKGFGDPNPGYLSAGYMIFNFAKGREFLATSYFGQNACPGDSGGPALVSYRNRITVVGIVSGGYSDTCKSGIPVVFVSTVNSEIARWIIRNR